MEYMAPVIKGVMAALLVNAIGIEGFSKEWWLAIISLNIMVNI